MLFLGVLQYEAKTNKNLYLQGITELKIISSITEIYKNTKILGEIRGKNIFALWQRYDSGLMKTQKAIQLKSM